MSTAERPKGWAENQRDSLRDRLPEGWQVWCVETPFEPGSGYMWCAKPEGAELATCRGGVLIELLAAVDEFEAELSAHVEATRAGLERTPNTETGRRRVLQSQLSGIMRLQARREAETLKNDA
jgi:hypothetical protein